ncbi:MAG: YebC/PmpR family DNA-binding transcriptional regulator [Candidatus Wildermuthbacteria bacterium]|nr:YebC/PmpR family DNA-binding transcriptional regulator [Candidatus Wildermuthbacteria bacterium]
MSGHSHFATIKHKKGLADAQRGNMFSKIAREITVAAKEGGGDPAANPRLRTVIEKAHSFNMPSNNVERAVKKGLGAEEGGAALEEMLLEAYGPGGVAILIQGITDNKNRTLGEIKQILAKYQGKMVEGGAVQWLFERKGVMKATTGEKTKDELELLSIEAGAQDTAWPEENVLEIYTAPAELDLVKKKLEEKGVKVESAGLEWVAKEPAVITQNTQETLEKLFAELDENDAVQDVYSNIK